MTRAIETSWWCGLLAVVGVAAGCSAHDKATPPGPGEVTVTKSQALTSANGLGQNGLSTNGLWANGLWANGLWANGLWANGLWANGLWANGLWANGLWANGLWANGLWANGLWANGLWANGLTGDAAVPGNTLRNSSYARELLQYIYACAMPATTYDTTIDPNNGTLACSPSVPCDVGYTCSSQGTCVVPLTGAIGLGINTDGSTWGGAGKCDESCQRWVSACVLARTNAYGVHVEISMRAPADAPQAIKDALAVSDVERNGDATHVAYSLREGAYYGNIFATTPVDPAPSPTYSGPALGSIATTPSFYACAGPGSNIPEITKRFCSSQGDQVVIKVPGVCLATPTEVGACVGEDTNSASPTFGAIQECFTSTDTSQPRTQYRQVITVYLKTPISVCGNAVCEPPTETTTNCPSDCHPGTWAKTFDPSFESLESQDVNLFQYTLQTDDTLVSNVDFGMSAVAPDDTIVMVGDTPSDIDLGGVTLPASQGAGILIKYNADGSYAWPSRGIRFDNAVPKIGNGNLGVFDVTVAATGPSKGNILVLGASTDVNNRYLWLSTFSAAGTSLSNWKWPIGDLSSLKALAPNRAIAVDSQGNVVSAGSYTGTATFPTAPPTSLVSSGFASTFLAKISLQDGSVQWAKNINTSDVIGSFILDSGVVGSLVIDTADNIVLAEFLGDSGLRKFCSDGSTGRCADGSMAWSKSVGGLGFTVAAVDASNNVYAGGNFTSGTDFGGGPVPTIGGEPPFIVKYDANGTFLWANHATTVCGLNGANCFIPVFNTNISFDPAGNAVLASWGNPSVGGGLDFGTGVFPTYRSNNAFLAAYGSNAGQPVWAKQIPGILGIDVRGMALDSQGRIVMSGIYAGSMEVDGHLLVTPVPEAMGNVAPFLASLGGPSPSDMTPPVIGAAADQVGSSINTVPRHIVAQATSSAGAVVFFMPPTALDTGNAGTSVACSPPPNTTFPIGTTTVRCTASDPLGNHASASFTITVADTLGPVFSPVADITMQATTVSGATVTYAAPTATDQVDGVRPANAVTCIPASGSVFAVGHTTVTCSASDNSNNQSQTTFLVNVTPPPDTTPPSITIPASMTVVATSASGAVVTYNASATDNVGVATFSCSPASGAVFPLGTTTVTCTATDTTGNRATRSFQVQVHYGWSGILQPINADGSSVFKLGSTVPVKFQLAGASAGIQNAAATLSLAKVSSTVVGTDIEAVSTSAATTGNAFSYDTTSVQYIFNLSTKSLSAGTWRLSIDLHDGVSRTITISLK